MSHNKERLIERLIAISESRLISMHEFRDRKRNRRGSDLPPDGPANDPRPERADIG
jgi:hypothetical protein